MKTLIIYHRDFDGITSALIARKEYPDAEMRSIEYSERDDFDLKNLIDTRVILVDFSFNEKTMIMIKARAKEFIWIDHHESSAKMQIWKDGSIAGLRSIKSAACELAWKTFIEHDPIPHAVRLIADRDMWRFEYGEDTKAFNEYLSQFDLDNEKDRVELNHIILETDDDDIYDFIDEGMQLLSYKESLIRKIVKKGAMKLLQSGLNRFSAFKCNSPIFTSDIGSYILDKYPDIQIAIIEQTIYYIGKPNKTIVSLRSRKDGVDVSKIAEKFDGGGHRQAAGYVIGD